MPSRPTPTDTNGHARLFAIAASPSGSSRLVATYDPDEFAASPVGRCIVGPTFALWCYSPQLQGAILWGVLDERAVNEMSRIAAFAHHPSLSARRRIIADCRALGRVDVDILLDLRSVARDRVAWLTAVERQAVIVSSSLDGIIIAGALKMFDPHAPLRVVQEPEHALAFVDHPDAHTALALATRIVAISRGRSTLLSRLRVQLGRDLVAATMEASATALGMSPRTLQRELRRLETSFSDELRRARVAAAEALLVHTDDEVGTIAARVGFTGAEQLDAVLRAESNVTASELRARQRC